VLINSQSLTGSQENEVPEYRSKERVERDGVLIYPEGDLIPESDTAELQRQGLLPAEKAAPKAAAPAANKAVKPAANK
jgi:hypothetical protein